MAASAAKAAAAVAVVVTNLDAAAQNNFGYLIAAKLNYFSQQKNLQRQ